MYTTQTLLSWATVHVNADLEETLSCCYYPTDVKGIFCSQLKCTLHFNGTTLLIKGSFFSKGWHYTTQTLLSWTTAHINADLEETLSCCYYPTDVKGIFCSQLKCTLHFNGTTLLIKGSFFSKGWHYTTQTLLSWTTAHINADLEETLSCCYYPTDVKGIFCSQLKCTLHFNGTTLLIKGSFFSKGWHYTTQTLLSWATYKCRPGGDTKLLLLPYRCQGHLLFTTEMYITF